MGFDEEGGVVWSQPETFCVDDVRRWDWDERDVEIGPSG